MMKIVLKEKETKKQSFLYKFFTNYYVWLVILIILMSVGKIWQCGFIISFMLWYKILDIVVRLVKYIIKTVKNILNTQEQ